MILKNFLRKIMEITKDNIKCLFTFVRTWDVTKYTPEGSADEYELRELKKVARLIYHHENIIEVDEDGKTTTTIPARWELNVISFDETQEDYKCSDIKTVEKLNMVLDLFEFKNKIGFINTHGIEFERIY